MFKLRYQVQITSSHLHGFICVPGKVYHQQFTVHFKCFLAVEVLHYVLCTGYAVKLHKSVTKTSGRKHRSLIGCVSMRLSKMLAMSRWSKLRSYLVSTHQVQVYLVVSVYMYLSDRCQCTCT